jgi:hypothetical protein
MTRYRLSGTVEEGHLSSVISAFSGAALRSQLDPEITLSLLSKFNEAPKAAAAEVIHAMPPAAKKRTVQRKTNGAEWPAKGSIYDVVLEAVQKAPMTPVALREVLKGRGFSAGSLNSSLGRLEKANKIRKGEGGWIAA